MSDTSPDRDGSPLVIAGIGSSAGGLEALKAFFGACQPTGRITYLIAQHLSGDYETALPDILGKATRLTVHLAEEGDKPLPDHVYVAPAGKGMVLSGGCLRLREPHSRESSQTLIDEMFTSLAEERAEAAAAVLLSGAGIDGTLGLRQIKGWGGLAAAQEPSEAKYDSMPRSAVASGLTDYVLPAAELPAALDTYADMLAHPGERLEAAGEEVDTEHFLEAILALLHDKTGHSFSGYKQRTMLRRIERRLQVRGIDDPEAYLKMLASDTDERQALLRHLLIGVTQFFRDEDTFATMRTTLIPRIVRETPEAEAIRVWVAACSTGEEAYSIAIVFHEVMESIGVRRSLKIFATDIDETSLERARQAVYDATTCAPVPEPLLKRYFTHQGDSYQVGKAIRDCCVFCNHNVLADAPFSRLDMVSCRNLLIYLNRETQAHLLERFHFALKSGGILVLGPSETASDTELFRPLNRQQRIYISKDAQRRRRQVLLAPERGRWRGATPSSTTPGIDKFKLSIERIILDHHAPVCLVINRQSEIVYFSRGTGPFLEPVRGEPSRQIATMVRAELRLELRSAIHKTLTDGVAHRRTNIPLTTEAGPRRVNLEVRPLSDFGMDEEYLMVLFEIQPAGPETDSAAEPPSEEERGLIEDLEEELARTKDYLRATIEELESSNEEMTSSNEELISLNEELQSANEELQTSREELQSTNEELVTTNAELQARIEELDQARGDIENLMASTEIATLFLDENLLIKRFTPQATHIFRLIATDVGRSMLDISSHLKLPHLLEEISTVRNTHRQRELEAVHEITGQTFLARISPYRPLRGGYNGVTLSFVDVTDLKRAREAAELRERFQTALSDLALRALNETDLNALFANAARAVAEAAEADMAKVLEYRPTQHDFLLRAGWNFNRATDGVTTVADDHDSQAGYTLVSNEPVVVEDYAKESRFQRSGILTEHDVTSGVSVIIPGETRPWGVLGIHSHRPRQWNETLCSHIQAVAQTLAFAISRARQQARREASEHRFSRVAAAVPAILMIRDAEGMVTYVNPVFCRLTGLTYEESLGKGWLRGISPKDRDTLDERFYKNRLPHEEIRLSYRLLLADGTERWFQHCSVPDFDEDGNTVAWFASAVDIQDYVGAEEARRRSEERFRQLAEAMPQIVWQVDTRGELVYINRRWTVYTGLDPNAPAERRRDVVHPDDRADFYSQYHHCLAKGQPFEGEYRLRRTDGTYRWHLARAVPGDRTEGKITTWFGTSTDIHDLKQAQTELQHSSERFRQLAEAIPQAVWTTTADGEADYYNKVWCDYVGAPPHRYMGSNWLELVHPDQREAARAAFSRSLKSGEIYEVEYQLRRHDGTYRWHLARGVPVRDEEGHILHWFGTCTDIETQKQAQEELNQASVRKDRFLAMLGHELRNPLAAIRNCSHVLNRPDAKAEHIRDCHEIIERQGAHLTRLVDDLLDLSRISTGRIELRQQALDLRDVLHHVVGDYETFLQEKKLKVDLRLPERPLPCHGDETRLAQCFGNILHNAYKFSPESGLIEIDARRTKGRTVTVTLRDHGLGMDRFRLQRLFTPYETYQEGVPTSGGLGLGLTVVKGLVELHGGTVTASSDGPGKGSLFQIILPLDNAALDDDEDEEQEGNGEPSTTNGAPARHKARQASSILLIEDDMNAARSIEMFFELEGHKVAIASSGEEALEKAREISPDVIICDICLPDQLGFDVVKKLREEESLKDVRIIAMSGLSRSSDRERAMESGFDGFVVKPPTPDQLLEACFPDSMPRSGR